MIRLACQRGYSVHDGFGMISVPEGFCFLEGRKIYSLYHKALCSNMSRLKLQYTADGPIVVSPSSVSAHG